MAIQTGVNVSKLVGYAVLTPMPGVDATKVVAYAVLASGNVTPPIWGSATPPDGTVGIAYSWSFDMPTSAETVSYSVLSGSLPAGLSLSAISHNQAHIHGTPTTAGAETFTIRATNSYGTADKEFTITIYTPAEAGVSVGGTSGWAN